MTNKKQISSTLPKLPLPKAALIHFHQIDREFLARGHADELLTIYEMSKGKEISKSKHPQDKVQDVIRALSSSPYWDCELAVGMYAGLGKGNGSALCCEPSLLGLAFLREKNETTI